MKRNKKQSRMKENFFYGQYRKSFEFILETKKFIYSVIGIFFAFALLGFFVPIPENLKIQIIAFMNQLLQMTENMNQIELTRFIFFNNVQSSFLGVLLGALFGIFPIMIAASNGYILGFVSLLAVNAAGISSLLSLFPHGIFELPAVFISLGMGLRIGTFVFRKEKIKSLKYFLENSLRTFVFVVVPLLVVAAIIEGGFIIMFR